MLLSEIAYSLHISYAGSEEIARVCIDSRAVGPKDLFVAIRGEHFDGHAFIPEAVARGAIAVLCTQYIPEIKAVQLVVPDTLSALIQMATYHRNTCTCPTIALTGSNGKTTVKEMIAAILPQPAHATYGNLNNHIGVPLSVLQLKPEHRFAVFELGANHIGEIAKTVAIVKPEVTLINNIAPAHIGEFGSIEGVARAKGEIHQGLTDTGTAVINEDDAYAHYWDSLLTNKKIIRFSRLIAAPIHAHSIVLNEQQCAQFTLVTPQGEETIQLRVPGEHNVSNALAACACAHALGISLSNIVLGLHQFEGVSGRMTMRLGKHHSRVIDDTYNANLRSALAALDVLATHKGRRIFVFGDMGELGDYTQAHHREVGMMARTHGIDALMTCGVYSQYAAQAFGNGAIHYPTQAALVQDLLKQLNQDTIVLVKGSRSAAMEKIVQQLL